MRKDVQHIARWKYKYTYIICNYIIYIIIYISRQLTGGSYWLNWICNYDYNRLLIREGIAVLNY